MASCTMSLFFVLNAYAAHARLGETRATQAVVSLHQPTKDCVDANHVSETAGSSLTPSLPPLRFDFSCVSSQGPAVAMQGQVQLKPSNDTSTEFVFLIQDAAADAKAAPHVLHHTETLPASHSLGLRSNWYFTEKNQSIRAQYEQNTINEIITQLKNHINLLCLEVAEAAAEKHADAAQAGAVAAKEVAAAAEQSPAAAEKVASVAKEDADTADSARRETPAINAVVSLTPERTPSSSHVNPAHKSLSFDFSCVSSQQQGQGKSPAADMHGQVLLRPEGPRTRMHTFLNQGVASDGQVARRAPSRTETWPASTGLGRSCNLYFAGEPTISSIMEGVKLQVDDFCLKVVRTAAQKHADAAQAGAAAAKKVAVAAIQGAAKEVALAAKEGAEVAADAWALLREANCKQIGSQANWFAVEVNHVTPAD